LCKLAETLLDNICEQYQMNDQKIDIIDNPQHYEKFKTSIPVLTYQNKELLWPFNHEDILKFIQKLS